MKEKVYLADGPLKGQVLEVDEDARFHRFEPGHVPYMDSGKIIRVFEYHPPREADVKLKQPIRADQKATADQGK